MLTRWGSSEGRAELRLILPYADCQRLLAISPL